MKRGGMGGAHQWEGKSEMGDVWLVRCVMVAAFLSIIFISAVQTRLGDKAPGDTQMKERIGPLYRELKREQGRSET